jgi:predicted MPP superfamily phosphohydrolase
MWISSEIHYERVKIKKKTRFGYRRKLGYRLTKPLRYKYKEGVFIILNIGYLWDGPSYMKWLEWLVGKKSSDGALAASAMHDIHDKLPVQYVVKNVDGSRSIRYLKLSIKDGAKFYNKLLDEWPDEDKTVKDWQSNIQEIGLIIFQPFYRLINESTDWELDE